MTITNMSEYLEKFRPIVEKGAWEDPEELWDVGREVFRENPFAQCTPDMAVWDIWLSKSFENQYCL